MLAGFWANFSFVCVLLLNFYDTSVGLKLSTNKKKNKIGNYVESSFFENFIYELSLRCCCCSFCCWFFGLFLLVGMRQCHQFLKIEWLKV